jgi:2-(1,2-epoxy-1,2-dihydrophenyl)acetyl-CoA isomerase
MSNQELRLEVSGGVARITINRPEVLNAIHTGMWAELLGMVQSIEHDREVRCLLLTGTGENFCAGGDVKEFSATLKLSDAERAQFWMRSADVTNSMFVALERIPQPVVVSARGVGAGGGMALVAAADLCVASDTARFFAAQIKLGAIPDSGVSYNMVRSIGLKRAKQYGMLGEVMDAKTALDLGLVNWVVPDAELEQRTEAVVAKLVKTPATALALTKATFNAAWNESLSDHFVQEARDVGQCVTAPDYPERVRAFIERRG